MIPEGNPAQAEVLVVGYSLQGGAVGRGVQWMGVVLHSKLVCNIM